MRRTIALGLFALTLSGVQADEKTKKPGREGGAAATMTGCLDQRGEKYVLTTSGSMQPASTLQGRAFSNDNFARYIGREVKVTGESKEGVFHVDKVEQVAETCR